MKDFLEFFGFRDNPFKITPDAHYFFLSESHQEALLSLKYLVDSEEGFAVIIGEPGTGKTLTVRKFIDDLPEDVEFAYILFPNLSPEELFEAILEDFGIKTEGETKNRIFTKLRDHLIEKRSKGKRVLIIIDEAQNLPVETLEELRILSNLETNDQKLIQIILIGQPELEEKLESNALRQLRQRITVITKLRNFTEKETRSYIDYRIAKAGTGNLRIHPKVYKLVYKYSLGIPRLINILMERSLMAAFVDGTHEIKPEHLERAAESVGIRVSKDRGRSVLTYASLFAVLLVTGYLGYVFFISQPETKAPVYEAPVQATPQTTDQIRLVTVEVPLLNVRDRPSPDSKVVYVLREGDRLEVLQEGPDQWIKVRFPEKGITGWVNGKYVSW